MSADEEIAPEDLDVGEEGGEEVMDEVRFLQFTQPHSIERTTVFSQSVFILSPTPIFSPIFPCALARRRSSRR